MRFTNCLFHNNHATESGGAIYNDHGQTDFFNCTFVNNSADVEGGGAYTVFDPVLANCIFWNNTDNACGIERAQVFASNDSEPVVSYCCIQGLDSFDGNGNIREDPGFVSVESGDFSLTAGSPCHDAGDNAVVTANTDLLGNMRFADDPDAPDTGNGLSPIVDMGAYEFAGSVPFQGGEDCNGNGIPDSREEDCNANGIPDDCDVTDGTSDDCAGEGMPDECEPDCNQNLLADSCDILSGAEADCDANGIPDSCDLANGRADKNGNAIPDECERPLAFAVGSRYLRILPAVQPDPVAIRVTSADHPCIDRYVNESGRLSDVAVFMMPHQWHALGISVTGAEIVPESLYTVVTEFADGELSPSTSVETWVWGDVDNSSTASFLDVLLIIQGVSGNFCNISLENTDLDSCAPNGVVNIADALRAIHAFQGMAFQTACGSPCGS